nr:PhoH family protein [Vibrio owensii]
MNLRAKISGVKSVEDYRSDRVVKTEALDDDGFLSIDFDIWERFSDIKTNGIDYTCAVKGDDLQEVLVPNRFIKKGDEVYRIVSFLEGILSLKLVVKKDVFGIFPKNERQLAGIDVLMDQDIGLVSLTGSAGCGKTLLAMAAALEQVLVQKVFDRIVVVRNTPPIAEDTGFFPGNEEEKMLPFLQGVVDALGVLGAEKDNKGTFEYLVDAANIEFRSINTMRGASLNKTFFIVEEGQNTTANAMKAMITRVGQTSKVVMTGNLNSSQIDASYATPWSNGLIRAIEVFTGHGRAAHVQLQGGQRGDIASHAEEFL